MSTPNPATKRVASRERLINILVAPHVSEKAARVAADHNQYVFRVRTDATKADIKAAVEFMFDVKVRAVQVVNQQGKEKRFGRFEGRRSDWKKAYVRLVEGQAIDFAGGDKA
ncbi:MAG: 50S ribosomal protein L23 [Steroidobacteraceae bacterium]|jgi:large subunit ribosomal protein L23|nr:50S ribosomal protein L23 [Steroidobacteraceae bacterium]MCC7199558.1 50S ribosomal protein L23 [Gammaproteobacteria bacterium]